MESDLPPWLSYSQRMQGDGAHIRLKLDTDDPIALSDFVGSFVGLGNQFEKFVGREHPDLKADSEIFVKEVRAGCIEADLVAVFHCAAAGGLLVDAIDAIDKAQILSKFISDLRAKIGTYFVRGGRVPNATKSDLADFNKTVRAIARDPNSSAKIEAAIFESDGRQVRAGFQFTHAEAQEAERQIAAHRVELELTGDADHSRVLLRFVRPSVEQGKPGKKGGERGIIEAIHPRALAVLYASDLAEQRVRHELVSTEGNVFRKLFDVDVNVELNASNRPIAFRVTNLHAVIDQPDDEGAGEQI